MPLGKNSRVNGYKRPKILEVRPLTPDDLRALAQPRPPTDTIKFLRERHHRIARLVAQGVLDHEVCTLVGISHQTLYRYRQDPAFRELVAQFGNRVDEEVLDEAVHVRREGYAILARTQRMIADHYDEADETGTKVPLNTLAKIGADLMDRFGFGKHSTQTNVNVGMGNLLEARDRLNRINVIDATTCPVAPSLPGPPASPGHLTAQAAPFKRRGL